MPRRLVLRFGGKRTDHLRCWQLPQCRGRDGADRMRTLSGRLSLRQRRDRSHAVRAGHHHKQLTSSHVRELRARKVRIGKRRDGMPRMPVWIPLRRWRGRRAPLLGWYLFQLKGLSSG